MSFGTLLVIITASPWAKTRLRLVLRSAIPYMRQIRLLCTALPLRVQLISWDIRREHYFTHRQPCQLLHLHPLAAAFSVLSTRFRSRALVISPKQVCIVHPRIPRIFRKLTFMLDSTPLPRGYNSIQQSDIALFNTFYGIWINGTQPVLINNLDLASVLVSLPVNEFPFKRLASVNSTDGSTTYLYHQINGSTFAEEAWDDKSQAWLPPEYIIVSDS